jgi:hypothetical protein
MIYVEKAYIYLITYPNGKIYIGQDRTDDVNYFGSANGSIIEKDFSKEEQNDFTIRKQVLKRFENIPICYLNKCEKDFILQYRSNDPAIGYNRYPGRINIERKKQTLYESSQNQSA